MELDQLDTDSMLGKDSKSIGSLTIGTGSGGVKMMGGAEKVIGSTTTFEFSNEVPPFTTKTKDAPPKFKAVEKMPPKFKAVGKKKPEFKITKK
jgi:hypothetical protein